MKFSWRRWAAIAALAAGCGNSVPTVGSVDAGIDATCGTGEIRCGATCSNTQTDPANCGTCGTRCQSFEACTAGRCVT